MNVQWHGEGDMVAAESFALVDLVLTLTINKQTFVVGTTATPEIESDVEYTRREVHKLLDRMVDELKSANMM